MLYAVRVSETAAGVRILLSFCRCVESLLRQGANPNSIVRDGVAAVHLAAGKESEKGLRCLKLVLQHGADPNLRSVTPALHSCALSSDTALTLTRHCWFSLISIHTTDVIHTL